MFRAIYDTATGQLISIGSVWPDPLPPGLSFAEYVDQPDLSVVVWDEAARDFIPRPAKVLIDRLEDLLADPRFADFQNLWQSLNASRRQQVRDALILLLGRRRWRTPSQDTLL